MEIDKRVLRVFLTLVQVLLPCKIYLQFWNVPDMCIFIKRQVLPLNMQCVTWMGGLYSWLYVAHYFISNYDYAYFHCLPFLDHVNLVNLYTTHRFLINLGPKNPTNPFGKSSLWMTVQDLNITIYDTLHIFCNQLKNNII